VDALIQRLATGGFDSLQAIIANTGQDLHHLPVAIIAAAQLAPDRSHGGWEHPVLEGSAVTQRARFACQNRHIVPRIIDRLASPEGAGMFANHHAILSDDDAFGVSMHIYGTSDCRVAKAVEILWRRAPSI
jgi:hypothetical protein